MRKEVIVSLAIIALSSSSQLLLNLLSVLAWAARERYMLHILTTALAAEGLA